MAANDRIRLDFTSDVSETSRLAIVSAIESVCKDLGLYSYWHFDKSFGGQSLDITSHDRAAVVDLTDGQVMTMLEGIAGESKLTIGQLLRAAAKIALEDGGM